VYPARRVSDPRTRWDARWAAACGPPGAPHPGVAELADRLAVGARVLDIAAGRGRQSLGLARAGHRVTACDVSPAGLQRLRQDAHKQGVVITTVVADLAERLPESCAGPWSAVVCVDYCAPALWPQLREVVAPGGVLFVSLATTSNLQRHARPSRRFVVEPHMGLEVLGELSPVVVSADWRRSGRHELWVWAVRPPDDR